MREWCNGSDRVKPKYSEENHFPVPLFPGQHLKETGLELELVLEPYDQCHNLEMTGLELFIQQTWINYFVNRHYLQHPGKHTCFPTKWNFSQMLQTML
jgi:hypothetical protein